MRWPKQRRQDFYALVKKSRGEHAARKLAAEVSEQWKIGAAIRDNSKKEH